MFFRVESRRGRFAAMMRAERIRELSFKLSLILALGFVGCCVVGFSIASGDLIEGLLLASLWGGSTLLLIGGVLAVMIAVGRIAARHRSRPIGLF